MEKYELVRDLGAGNFGVARLLRHKETKELVAVKYIPRGHKVGVVSLSNLSPRSEARKHLIRREPRAAPQDLRLRTPPSSSFFSDILGHMLQSSLLHSQPKSTVGTPAYIAPEVLSRREYDGKVSSVISPLSFSRCFGDPSGELCRQCSSNASLADTELTEAAQAQYYKRDSDAPTYSLQSIEEIMRIVGEAQTPPPSSTPVAGFGWPAGEDEGKQDEQDVSVDEEDEYEKRVKEVRASGAYPLVD
ncbi:hypothetical protein BHE74_00055107 [Ensete ventricosum]|nr:hypothetical protein GW17_00016864 [Ensete ventricosum]RWW39557.1 hypothetical protein BHE74_00055107 [Ensete ventricosum]